MEIQISPPSYFLAHLPPSFALSLAPATWPCFSLGEGVYVSFRSLSFPSCVWLPRFPQLDAGSPFSSAEGQTLFPLCVTEQYGTLWYLLFADFPQSVMTFLPYSALAPSLARRIVTSPDLVVSTPRLLPSPREGEVGFCSFLAGSL